MAQAQKNKGVRTKHSEYTEMLSQWKKCRDVFAGTEELREHTTEYLPELTDEPPSAYQARLNRTVLYNATYRTIQGMIGMVFRRPPVAECPLNTESMLEDITLTGIPLTAFAQDIAEECMVVGRVGLYVNYPITSDSMTIADAQALNVRPYMSIVRAEQIINWRQRRVNNKYALSMAVIQEEHSIPIDEFEDKEVTRYRVLDLDENDVYRVRIFEVQEKNRQSTDVEIERFYPTMNGARMNYIPLYIMGSDNVTPDIDTPMMIDIVDTNIAHYQAFADLSSGCHWSGTPTMTITGHELAPNETLHVGAGKALVLPNPAAKATMVEVGTAGFSALDSLLNRLEMHMVSLGSRLLEGHKVQAESAQTAMIYRAGEQSILASVAQSISTGITIALKTFAEWAGDDSANVRFDLNREFFAQPVTPEMLNALVSAWQLGGISAESRFAYLKRSEFYQPHEEFEDEEKLIEAGKPKEPVKPPVLTTIKRNSDGSMTAERAA